MAINKADYVNPTTGNVVASDELITDIINASNENINPTFTMYEHINNALNQITSPVKDTFATVSGFSLTIPEGKYLVSFQTGVQATISLTGSAAIALPTVRLYSSAISQGVGFETSAISVSNEKLSSVSSVHSSFVLEALSETTLSVQIRVLSNTATSSYNIEGLYARTDFPASSGFIRAIKIA